MPKPSSGGRLRIIGGEWRGRRLPVPRVNGLRPTTDRTRETVFNWLAPELAGRHCLDLFAGSGALGLEALSRGAASCLFVDLQRGATDQIRRNLETLSATDRGVVRNQSAISLLKGDPIEPRPDLVFVDPPFGSDLLNPTLELLLPLLADDALVYLEHAKDQAPADLQGWVHRRSKFAGGVSYGLLERP